MPRGGRRPGAGAPKGNFNGLGSCNYSIRLVLIYAILRDVLDGLATRDVRARVKRCVIESGCFPPPSYAFTGDLRGICDVIWHEFFDSPQTTQSNAIKDRPPVRTPLTAARRRQNQNRAEHLRRSRYAKKFTEFN